MPIDTPDAEDSQQVLRCVFRLCKLYPNTGNMLERLIRQNVCIHIPCDLISNCTYDKTAVLTMGR